MKKIRLIPKYIHYYIKYLIISVKGAHNKVSHRAKFKTLNDTYNVESNSLFPLECVSVGKHSYGDLNVVAFNRNTKLLIGHYVSIAQNVTFLLDVEHYLNHISSFPFHVKVVEDVHSEAFSKGNIIVEDDVWIGYGSTILSGVHIGQGAIIAAEALVTKDVEPYSIVGGTPARIIRKRFDDEIIDYLLSLDYSMLTEELINDHIEDLYLNIDGKEVDEIKEIFAWFPKKYLG